MQIKNLIKKSICFGSLILFSLNPILSYAEVTDAQQNSSPQASDNSMLMYGLIGAGVLAAGGIAVALSHHSSHTDPTPSPHNFPSGGNCNADCQQAIDDAAMNFKRARNIPVLQIAFEGPSSEFTDHIDDFGAKNTKLDEGNRFLSGSITRVLQTAVLVEFNLQNLLNLDDTVGTLLKKSTTPVPIEWQNVTVRQLMNMTSGIPNYATQYAWWNAIFEKPDTSWSYDELIRVAATADKKMDFDHGKSWEESNTNDAILEKIVNAVSDLNKDDNNYPTGMEEALNGVISLLHLNNTTIYDTSKTCDFLQNNIAHNRYRKVPSSDPVYGKFYDKDLQCLSPSALRTSGGLISNVDDINTTIWTMMHDPRIPKQFIDEINNNMVCTGIDPDHSCVKGSVLNASSTDVGYVAGLYRFGLNKIGYPSNDIVYYLDGQTPGSTTAVYYYRNDAKNIDFVVSIAVDVGENNAFPALNDLYKQILGVVLGTSSSTATSH